MKSTMNIHHRIKVEGSNQIQFVDHNNQIYLFLTVPGEFISIILLKPDKKNMNL